MPSIFAVAIGGACGSVARYVVCVTCQRWLGDWFAWGVLFANALGCLAIGFLMQAAQREQLPLSQAGQVGIVVGLLGGFTTFSALGYDTVAYWQAGSRWVALANVVANLFVGLIMVAIGQWLTGRTLPSPPLG